MSMGKLILRIIFLMLTISAAEAQPIRVQPQLINAEKGLPSNTVFEVVEGAEGLLWISTEQGVYIYDGYTITALNNFLKDSLLRNEPASLYKEKNGTIWIHQIGILLNYDNKKRQFNHYIYSLNEGIAKKYLQPISENKGELILQNFVDSCLVFNTATTKFNLRKLPDNFYVDSIHKANAPIYCNGFYFKINIQNELLLVDAKGNKIRKIKDLEPSNDIIRFTSIIPIDNQNCLVGSGIELLVVNTQSWQVQPIYNIFGSNLISTGKIMNLYKNRSDRIYMATNSSGVFSIPIQLNQFSLFRSSNPKNNFIRSIFQDSATQKVYAGLYFNSVAVFNGNAVPDEYTTSKWQKLLQTKRITVVNRVDKIGAREWIVFANGRRFYYLDDYNDLIKEIPLKAPLGMDSLFFANDNLSSFANVEKMADGNYILVYLRQILQVKYKSGVFQTTKIIHTIKNNEGVFIDKSKHIFIGSEGYVDEYAPDLKLLQRLELPQKIQVKAIAKDEKNSLWVGTRNGIFVYTNHGAIQKITEQNGLLNGFIYALHSDAMGFVWCSTNRGLASINTNNFSVSTFTKYDGLQDDEFNSGAMYIDPGGKIYFGGINGIIAFHPKNIQKTLEKERVNVLEVKGNGKTLYSYLLNGRNALVSDNTINNFVFYFSAFGLNPAANIYEYKVNNDKSWVPIRGQNFFNLYLTGGIHEIYIRKLNQPETETVFTLKVRLPFYQQSWFLVFAAINLLIITGLFINRRQKNLLREKERLLNRELELQVERERISKELHDNLGAHANIISYHSQQLSKTNSSDFDIAIANNTFGKIKSSADEILLSLRETVWALQQSKITSREAWIRFQNFIFRLQDSFQNVHFILADMNDMPELEVEYQQAVHLIRILQEATNNAVKHASASTIKIDIQQQAYGFIISVKDNGVGFDVTQQNINGSGLENIHSRAKAAGLIVAIESSVGRGTVVNISFKST